MTPTPLEAKGPGEGGARSVAEGGVRANGAREDGTETAGGRRRQRGAGGTGDVPSVPFCPQLPTNPYLSFPAKPASTLPFEVPDLSAKPGREGAGFTFVRGASDRLAGVGVPFAAVAAAAAVEAEVHLCAAPPSPTLQTGASAEHPSTRTPRRGRVGRPQLGTVRTLDGGWSLLGRHLSREGRVVAECPPPARLPILSASHGLRGPDWGWEAGSLGDDNFVLKKKRKSNVLIVWITTLTACGCSRLPFQGHPPPPPRLRSKRWM